MPATTRRQLLAATALIGLSTAGISAAASARSYTTRPPMRPGEVYPPPDAFRPGGWLFLTPQEAATLDAITDRLIPADELGAGGKDAGCTVFIDRQLAGPYGTYEWLYMKGPFAEKPLPFQGIQSPLVPREQYRRGLAALAKHCSDTFAGKRFEELSATDQDKLLIAMEKGEANLPGLVAPQQDTRGFFNLLLQNTMEGYFADPVYGGNKNMVGWRMINFPGVRYDFRDVLEQPGQRYTKPPVAIMGRPEWTGRPA